MNSTVVPAIIVSLLSTTLCCQQYADSVHLINRLNGFFHFDHNIFLIDSSIDLSCWFPMSSTRIKLDNSTPQTVYTGDYLSASDDNIMKITKNPFLIVVVEGLKFENDSQLWTHVKALRWLDINIKIGVFLARNITSLDIVDKLFRWSWSVGIVNIFCAFHIRADYGPLNVFRYDPFGGFELINVTQGKSLRDHFPDKVPNYRKSRLGGHPSFVHDYDKNFWDAVIFVFKASRSPTSKKASMYREVYFIEEALQSSQDQNLPRRRFAYSHRQKTLLLLVPHAQPYSDFAVYLQNATWTLLIIYVFIVIVSSSVLLIVSGYLREKKFLLFKSVDDVVNLLMNDNAGIRYGKIHCADMFVIVPLTFTGLIVMNGIVSLFQSFITSPIYQPQINSLHDLYKSSVPILEKDFWKDVTVEILENRTGYGGWSSKVQGLNHDQRIEAIETFKNSIAFFASESNSYAYSEVQKRLSLEAYHTLGGTFISKTLMAYLVDKEYPYKECLSDIVHWLTGAGLIEKWNNDELVKHTKSLLNKTRKSQKMVNESDNSEFAVPTVVWCGWIASAVVFICEIIWNLKKKLLSG